MTEGRYILHAAPRGVFDGLVLKGTVTTSNDPDCNVGTTVRMSLLEARKGRSKVVYRSRCAYSGTFTTPRKATGDTLRVRIRGLRPPRG